MSAPERTRRLYRTLRQSTRVPADAHEQERWDFLDANVLGLLRHEKYSRIHVIFSTGVLLDNYWGTLDKMCQRYGYRMSDVRRFTRWHHGVEQVHEGVDIKVVLMEDVRTHNRGTMTVLIGFEEQL